jgi:flagellar hook-basal body complex protein FliE
MINSIEHINNNLRIPETSKNIRDDSGNSFGRTLDSLIDHVDGQIKEADTKTRDFALGRSTDMVDVMVSTEKASVSFQFLLQIRNKLLEGYQEIMRMNF